MTRREARIATMQILYSADFNGISLEEARKDVASHILTADVNNFLDMVESNKERIDDLISKSLENYSLNRLNIVDRAIIRLATAEFIDGKTDKRIVINEALEITKQFSDQGDHKATGFNNRLLENIYKNL
jgi:N utilization substance protein B